MDITSIEYMAMAKQAADEFISTESDLSSAIAKLADAKDLSQVQIQRVVEMANHEVNDIMRKQAEDKTFCFDVATLDGVLAVLHEDSDMSIPKVAAASVRTSVKDYIGRESKDALFDAMQKEAHAHPLHAAVRVKRVVDDLTKVAQRIRAYRSETEASEAGAHAAIREKLAELTEHALNHLASHNNISDLKKFACSAFPEDGQIWDAVFSDIRGKLMDKLASTSPMVRALKRDKNVPSDEIPVEVINGRHGYMVELNTLKNKISEADQYAKRRRLLDTLGPAVIKTITEIKDSKDVDDYISKEIETHKGLAADKKKYFKLLDSQHSKIAEAMDKVASLSLSELMRAGKGANGKMDPRAIALMAFMNSEAARPWDMTRALGSNRRLDV